MKRRQAACPFAGMPSGRFRMPFAAPVCTIGAGGLS